MHDKLEKLRAQVPGRPILLSEFGSWTIRGMKTDYFPGEAFQSAKLTTMWKQALEEENVIGAFIWVFADARVHRRFLWAYEFTVAYGLFDSHRRPKEAAYAMRKLWNESRRGRTRHNDRLRINSEGSIMLTSITLNGRWKFCPAFDYLVGDQRWDRFELRSEEGAGEPQPESRRRHRLDRPRLRRRGLDGSPRAGELEPHLRGSLQLRRPRVVPAGDPRSGRLGGQARRLLQLRRQLPGQALRQRPVRRRARRRLQPVRDRRAGLHQAR